MARYAVLWDIDSRESRQIGIAIERGDHVHVDVPEELGIASRYDGEYRVLQPDLNDLVYRPGDEGYFEQVLIELSRTFAIGERDEVESSDEATIMTLLRTRVLERTEANTMQLELAGPELPGTCTPGMAGIRKTVIVNSLASGAGSAGP